MLQMKQLPCIKQYVLGRRLKSIITITNNLQVYLGAWVKIEIDIENHVC